MTSLNEMATNLNTSIKLNFNGGELIGDAGILLYKEFDHVIGLPSSFRKSSE